MRLPSIEHGARRLLMSVELWARCQWTRVSVGVMFYSFVYVRHRQVCRALLMMHLDLCVLPVNLSLTLEGGVGQQNPVRGMIFYHDWPHHWPLRVFNRER